MNFHTCLHLYAHVNNCVGDYSWFTRACRRYAYEEIFAVLTSPTTIQWGEGVLKKHVFEGYLELFKNSVLEIEPRAPSMFQPLLHYGATSSAWVWNFLTECTIHSEGEKTLVIFISFSVISNTWECDQAADEFHTPIHRASEASSFDRKSTQTYKKA